MANIQVERISEIKMDKMEFMKRRQKYQENLPVSEMGPRS